MAQLSYVHGASETPLIGQTIGNYFDRAAEQYGARDALIVRHQSIRWSWRELKQRVDDFAAGLLALGLKRGERIGIWSPNNAEWVVTQFATAKAGLILVNINPAYRVTELEYALNKAGCSGTDYGDAVQDQQLPGNAGRAGAGAGDSIGSGALRAARLPALRLVITISEDKKAGFGSI